MFGNQGANRANRPKETRVFDKRSKPFNNDYLVRKRLEYLETVSHRLESIRELTARKGLKCFRNYKQAARKGLEYLRNSGQSARKGQECLSTIEPSARNGLEYLRDTGSKPLERKFKRLANCLKGIRVFEKQGANLSKVTRVFEKQGAHRLRGILST